MKTCVRESKNNKMKKEMENLISIMITAKVQQAHQNATF